MTRTFIALEMHEALQSHLAGVIRQVAQALPSVRFVDPGSVHITLAFLGELTEEQVAQAILAAETAAAHAHPFAYRLARVGIFGSQRNPRVIWLGIDEPSGLLAQLHRALTQALAQRGFEVDTRPFSPHLTLARVKHPLSPDEQQHLQQLLAGRQEGIISPHAYSVERLDVIKSELLRSGARYTTLRECVLGAS